LQQKPSAQKPLLHWLAPVQAEPTASFRAHTPFGVHHASDRQSASDAQVTAQDGLVPSQRLRAQSWRGVEPSASAAQVPLAGAPVATVQAAQAVSHAELQQAPSTQKELAHSRTREHSAPGALRATHAPCSQ